MQLLRGLVLLPCPSRSLRSLPRGPWPQGTTPELRKKRRMGRESPLERLPGADLPGVPPVSMANGRRVTSGEGETPAETGPRSLSIHLPEAAEGTGG